MSIAQELKYELAELNKKIEKYDYTIQNGMVVMQKIIEVPGMNASQLYSSAKNFVIVTYNSPNQVIQNDDPINGHLVVKGLFETTTCKCGDVVFWGNAMEYTPSHILKFDVKDERIRITIVTTTIKQRYGDGRYVPVGYIDYSVTQLYPISKNIDVFTNNHAYNIYPKDGSKKQQQGFLHEGYVLHAILEKMQSLLTFAEAQCSSVTKIQSEDNW